MKKEFKITGMTCDHCRRHVENTIRQVEGVSSVNVDLAKGMASVEADREIDLIVLEKAFEEEGGLYKISEPAQ